MCKLLTYLVRVPASPLDSKRGEEEGEEEEEEEEEVVVVVVRNIEYRGIVGIPCNNNSDGSAR
ncbi:hypothetical protein BO70DRAFT_366781 [Aspergillus heteromorphus CBS 117.55]|uniref:Uncharacterized protein n=1 Tax=Aspergillus heteromorphus CBS 117.55 TaxID=1448321 RepID=A0A317UXU6_9EURO|nr:uncharacterized protein BO70DRAFT_366781 [Aspergillus heteromorphus CBS 117.55]PWY65337.1 hypothetical protein BO70DRAFT_366781 [Aspergillus heteromorphus CBS 117.55]